MFNTNREVEYTYMGGTKKLVSKIIDGVRMDTWVTSPDHREMCIYKIQNHNVNLRIIRQDGDSFKKTRYRVVYLLLHKIEMENIGEFIHASENYRTMWFTNPSHPEGKKIGIPIMNIVSCEKVRD